MLGFNPNRYFQLTTLQMLGLGVRFRGSQLTVLQMLGFAVKTFQT